MRHLIILITLLTITVTSLSANNIVGTWHTSDGQSLYQFDFNSNGTYSVTANGNRINGTWQVANSVLTTNMNGTTASYRYAFEKGYLVLAASRTEVMILGKDKSYFQNLLAQSGNSNNNTNTNSNSNQRAVLSDAEFLNFLQNYETMTPNNIYITLTRMSKEQQQWIPIFQAWYSMMMYHACQGNQAYNNQADSQACAYAKASHQNTVQLLQSSGLNSYSGLGDPWSEGKLENGKLITQYLKKAGKISNATYNTYMGVQSDINKMQNETTQTIIDNFKSPPCVEHYEEGTHAYLGCY